jgi:hypothetical protein
MRSDRLCACPRCTSSRDTAKRFCLRCAIKGCRRDHCACLTTPTPAPAPVAVVVDPSSPPPRRPRPEPVYVERATAPRPPRREFWTLSDLAERHGLRRPALKALLDAAGVRGRKRGRYALGEVDAAVAARKAQESAPPATPPGLAPHEPDADGNVGCATCWSMAFITRGRSTVCRWCVAARAA